jgi:transposase
MAYTLYLGVDIAAETATTTWQDMDSGEQDMLTIEQQESGYERLLAALPEGHEPGQTLVVMEATGNYWLKLAWYLQERGYVVSVINPTQARHFARMQLQRTKTDAIDARLLADFAKLMKPAPWTPPPAVCEQLQQRLAQREDLLAVKTQESNRLHALRHHPHADPSVLERFERHLRFLAAEVKALDCEIKALLFGDHAWSVAARRLTAIPGIGLITAAWILVATHQFARCQTPEQAAAFAGLVPHAQDSGTSRRGKRSVGGGGHAALRRALYMAAISATRFNRPVKTFYQRLLSRGKPKKLALVAAARKLLHIAWAVVVKHRDFDPDYSFRVSPHSVGA